MNENFLLLPEEFEKRLREDLKQGTAVQYKVKLPRPVGVDLLDTISSDLYKNPLHVLRELIQNSYDEGATNVRVMITGGSVVIEDNGRGMNPIALASCRRVAESEKVYNPEKYGGPVRGFRKMGIYAGYQIAERLTLVTKVSEADLECQLIFDFHKMREEQLKNRARAEDERWDFQ